MIRFRIRDFSSSIAVGLIVFGCGGGGKILTVKSDPADAEVCIKGKARSEHFSNAKTCIGNTPFEADRVEITTADGEKKEVKFKDVEGDHEQFYVIVSRPGYATQSFEVPSWEHFVALKPEGGVATAAAPMQAAPVPQQRTMDKGMVKITSEPNGVLVYIDGALQGNTPFTYEGGSGPVRMKLEMDGFRTMEKVLTLESGRSLNLNFKLLSEQRAEIETAKSKPVQTAPINVEDDGLHHEDLDRVPASGVPAITPTKR